MGIRLPSVPVGEMQFSASRIVTFLAAVGAILATWTFLKRTFMGTAIRAISQDRGVMPLLGVNPDRVYLLTSAIGGLLVGLAACLLVLQYDVHPAIGLTFGPLIFLICVLGGLGNLLGGMAAAFLFAQFISLGGYFLQVEWGQVIAFVFFILAMFWRPQGLFARSA
jgi:branched-chain amino acid transport system permease protein